jgi:hypothetical protein
MLHLGMQHSAWAPLAGSAEALALVLLAVGPGSYSLT